MWPCILAAFILMIAAFIAPGVVGTALACAAVLVFCFGLVLGGVERRG